jgi:hypothetical protein
MGWRLERRKTAAETEKKETAAGKEKEVGETVRRRRIGARKFRLWRREKVE